MLENIWIHDYSTSAKLAPRPKTQIINPIIEMVIKNCIRIVTDYFLIHYSATTKIRNMKMINNTKSLTLSLFLFLTNLPTMSRDREHMKTTDHRWISFRHNHWHNIHLSIKKYQNMACKRAFKFSKRKNIVTHIFSILFHVQSERRP